MVNFILKNQELYRRTFTPLQTLPLHKKREHTKPMAFLGLQWLWRVMGMEAKDPSRI